MNRRSFISSLLAGTVAPAFLPGAGRRWFRTPEGIIVPNPDYETAPFEIDWLWNGAYVMDHQITRKGPWPLRFKDALCTKPIFPFKIIYGNSNT